MLIGMPDSDPEYNLMRIRFEQASDGNASAGAFLGKLFLIGPRATYRVAGLPAAARAIVRRKESPSAADPRAFKADW